MLGFKQIELSDKDILDNFFMQTQNQISDTTFTNLYMWRRCYAVRWAVVEGHLVVQPNAWESSWVLPPYGHTYDDDDFKSAVEILADEFHDAGKEFVIRGITEREKDRMERIWPDRFAFTEERDIADYIYNGDDLRELKGRKYSKKRNHLNAFLREYPDYEFHELTKENVPEVLDFLEYWYGEQNKSGNLLDSLLCEREAVYDALMAIDELAYVGGFIRIDGRIVALTMGEKVNEDTVVIHIEKAFAEYRGLYAAINKVYLNHIWPTITYVNREEDMGLEGLRRAKESYYPAYLLMKYKAVWKND